VLAGKELETDRVRLSAHNFSFPQLKKDKGHSEGEIYDGFGVWGRGILFVGCPRVVHCRVERESRVDFWHHISQSKKVK
jgi:hypothetical protein